MSDFFKLKPFKLDLGLKGTHVLVTGAAGYIGKVTVAAFLSAGANVSCLDINESGLEQLCKEHEKNIYHEAGISEINCIAVDIVSESGITKAFKRAAKKFGPVQCCVALASLDLSVLEPRASIIEMPFGQWKETFETNVHGTFLTARAWLQGISAHDGELENVSLILVGSESGSFGEREHPDYASAKSAIQGGLLQSLKADAPRVMAGAR
ncbi:MAG: hypothetical protein M1828_001327 [Chrysothrix sp. TS-e1954]|nr:MAG: hypothetical protein M1828_001327 [Chrysothrix sp. TS-e1954]